MTIQELKQAIGNFNMIQDIDSIEIINFHYVTGNLNNNKISGLIRYELLQSTGNIDFKTTEFNINVVGSLSEKKEGEYFEHLCFLKDKNNQVYQDNATWTKYSITEEDLKNFTL